MAKFELAIPEVFKHEGGFVNDPNDRGGCTNMGITLAFYKKCVDVNADIDTIRYLTADKAANIYREYFWDRPGYERIVDQHLANKIFDLSVNVGVPQANKFVQLALNNLYPDTPLMIDGILGHKSIDRLNSGNFNKIYQALIAQAATYYNEIAEKGNNKKFLTGWLNRLRA